MPKVHNIIYLLLFITLSQLMIIGVMNIFEFSYNQSANWVFGIMFALIAIATVRIYIKTKRIQQSFIDRHNEFDFKNDNAVMLSQYKSLIERLDDPQEKARLMKEFDLIVVLNKSGNELYKNKSSNAANIEAMEQSLQRLENAQIERDTKSS